MHRPVNKRFRKNGPNQSSDKEHKGIFLFHCGKEHNVNRRHIPGSSRMYSFFCIKIVLLFHNMCKRGKRVDELCKGSEIVLL
jgi:hypothetical protein|uniref:Uncharacterized protein n=1 Tax=Zea mays TaxID=4577 RepID=B4FE14_MAIZE|nr:unknown [Zea mays]ACG45965.1 hypothetical protein [Zea mays]